MKLPNDPPHATRIKRMKRAAELISTRYMKQPYWTIERISAASGAEVEDVKDLASGEVMVSETGQLVYRGGAA